MIYAKLDVRMWSHKRFVRAGAAATGLWCAALAWLRDDESSTGNLSVDEVGVLLGLGSAEAVALADRLVDVGLFERIPDGYHLLKYADKNETKEEIEERRKDVRERVAKSRAKRNVTGNSVGNADTNSVTHGVSTLCVPGSDSGSDSDLKEGERERAAPAAAKLPAGVVSAEMGFWIDGYERGATRARGFPFTFPKTEYRFADTMSDLVAKHCTDRTRMDGWWDRAAFAFFRSVGSDTDWRYGLGPKGMLEWFNRGRPGYKAPGRPAPPPAPLEKPSMPLAQTAQRAAELVAGLGKGGA